MLIAIADRRCAPSTAMAAPGLRVASSSSNSMRKLVSSSSMPGAFTPGTGSLSLECLHGVQ